MPKAHIIGLGRSGIAAAKILQLDGWEVEIGDRANTPSLQTLQASIAQTGIAVKLNYTLDLEVNQPQLLVVSPGVPWDSPLLLKARSQNIDTIGELELAWRYLKTTPWLGITGTNGKTTTTALTAAILQTAGLKAPACGNIGYAASELALATKTEGKSYDWIVAEISSYQIESSQDLTPQIALWTTFTPDHLSRHYTLENYYKIKASLLKRAPQQIFNGDDPYLRNVAPQWEKAYWTSVKGPELLLGEPTKGIYLESGWIVAFGEKIAPIDTFGMVGSHNQQNLLMAVGAAKLVGVEREAIAEAIATFPGVPHRLEAIVTYNGIQFINDSKATNYDAAQVGLASLPNPAILIAGGEPKQGDDKGWIETIKAKATTVLLIGEAAPSFAKRFQQEDYHNHEIVETMERAVPRAFKLAKDQGVTTILLSPACASFDQYQSFEYRGDHFRQLCLNLAQ